MDGTRSGVKSKGKGEGSRVRGDGEEEYREKGWVGKGQAEGVDQDDKKNQKLDEQRKTGEMEKGRNGY